MKNQTLEFLNTKIILICFLSLVCSFYAGKSASVEREPIWLDRENYNIGKAGDFCPKKQEILYNHHFVLIDATTPLDKDRIGLIQRLILNKDYIEKELIPYDRLTIMILSDEKSPKLNVASFSKCRFRTGNPGSVYEIDHANWFYESKTQLNDIHQEFLNQLDEVIDELRNKPGSRKTLLMEQIFEISRLADNGFNSNYQYQRLTIVSDLVQNSERLNMYSGHCKLHSGGKCKSLDSMIKKDKKLKNYLPAIIPQFEGKVDVEILYLHNNSDPNLDKGVIQLWEDYFRIAGIDKIKLMYEGYQSILISKNQ